MIKRNLISSIKRIIINGFEPRPIIQPYAYSFGTYKCYKADKYEFLYEQTDAISAKVEADATQFQNYILFARQPGDTGGTHQDHKHAKKQTDAAQDKQFPGVGKKNNPDEGSGDMMRDSKAAKEHLQDEKYDRGGVSEQSANIDDEQKRKRIDPIQPDTKEHKRSK